MEMTLLCGGLIELGGSSTTWQHEGAILEKP